MRFDWYLKHDRVVKAGGGQPRVWLRKVLGAVGESWVSSPVRRMVQGGFFVGFLWLFFYAVWPYGASPGWLSSGWLPVEVDGETGKVVLVQDGGSGEMVAVSQEIFVVDEMGQGLGWFKVKEMGDDGVVVIAMGEVDEQRLDRMSMSFGPWQLREVDPNAWPSHHARDFERRLGTHGDVILAIDPLVSISTAVAARAWVWSLIWAGILLAICVFIPRGFCGYICPLGTLIDVFDWLIGKRVTRFRVGDSGWWVHIKYYVLAGVMAAALLGVLLSGFVAAIPVVTRGLMFVLGPVQTGMMRGWHQVPPIGIGHWLSIGLFFVVLGLGFLRERFWCKYVCPSGAVFSVFNLLRVNERKVEQSCINCNNCVEICPFDAIKGDYTTRVNDCTLCQSCAGVCPTGSIKFVERWNKVELKVEGQPTGEATRLGRRGFMSTVFGGVVGVAGGVSGALVGKVYRGSDTRLVRPPGSVPEDAFLQMCIRCGECFKACPNNVLQPVGFEQGLDGLWTPKVVADWSGCEPSCNNCGHVCPTGAIRALSIEEKKDVRMGLAVVNARTCLPLAEREACQLCVDECVSAGYDAIEFERVGVEVDEQGMPIAGTGYLGPVVLTEKCVGCGLCQTRCYVINVKTKGLLEESAIVIEAGEGKEDRVFG